MDENTVKQVDYDDAVNRVVDRIKEEQHFVIASHPSLRIASVLDAAKTWEVWMMTQPDVVAYVTGGPSEPIAVVQDVHEMRGTQYACVIALPKTSETAKRVNRLTPGGSNHLDARGNGDIIIVDGGPEWEQRGERFHYSMLFLDAIERVDPASRSAFPGVE